MKFYLSSYRIPNLELFTEFIGKGPKETNLALILNAKDYKTNSERKEKRGELLSYFSGLGFSVEEVNLLEFGSEGELSEKLRQFDILWFNGGNTYCLNWAVREGGVDKVLKEVLEGGVVYAGDSAGAILAGPTLRYLESVDDPSLAPEAIYEGLGFVDFVPVPHWNSEEFGDLVKETNKKLEEDGFKTVKLKDDEALLVENGEVVRR